MKNFLPIDQQASTIHQPNSNHFGRTAAVVFELGLLFSVSEKVPRSVAKPKKNTRRKVAVTTGPTLWSLRSPDHRQSIPSGGQYYISEAHSLKELTERNFWPADAGRAVKATGRTPHSPLRDELTGC